jgi:hypothetical protein
MFIGGQARAAVSAAAARRGIGADTAVGGRRCERAAIPVLDADITVVPDGEHAALVELVGVYRPPPWAGLCPVIAYLVTAATTHSLLGRIAAAISDPPAARRGQADHAAVRPGTLAVAWPMTAQRGKAENLEALTGR